MASLAHLDVADECGNLVDDLSSVLDFMAVLDSVDTSGVEPFIHPHLEGAAREDEVSVSLTREDALAGAPEASDGMFVTGRPNPVSTEKHGRHS
jgi:aspartyl-tRNA(Asn)/glutamyl-tRNA(Gln) amidotransferase subunit C